MSKAIILSYFAVSLLTILIATIKLNLKQEKQK